MSKHLIAFALSAFAILMAVITKANAQTPNSAITVSQPEAVKDAQPQKLSVLVDLGSTSNLESPESAASQQSTTADFNFVYTLNPDWTLRVNQSFTQTHSGLQDFAVNNGSLSASFRKIRLDRDNELGFSGKLILPVNEEDREQKSFRAAIAPRVTLSTKKSLAGKALSITSYIEGLKNSHAFERTNTGEANLSYRGRVLAAAELELNSTFSAGVSAYYQAGRTYSGALRTGYSLAQEVSARFGAATSIYVSHENGGNPLGANGTDYNIEIADARTSTVSLGLRTKF